VSAIRVVHAFTFFHALGGVSSMLRRNWEGDARHGLASQFLAYFEPDDGRTERVRGLGLTWRNTIHQARARFRQRLPAGAEVISYGNVWGVPFFADLDAAPRRIGALHGASADMPDYIRHARGCLDGVICVSEPHRELAARLLPELTADRIGFLPNPAGRTRVDIQQPPLAGRPLVIGYSGRLARGEKRVDRLPLLVRELDRLGLSYRLEILGDGPERASLQRQFAGRTNVILHGRRRGEDYWTVLRQWDVLVLVSDFEGMPVSLLEGLSVGVIPLLPRIGSGGDAYAARVRDDLLYPAGDLGAAARAAQALTRLSADELAALRRRGGEVVQPHLGECDLAAMSAFVRRIHEMPRLSPARFPPRPFHWADHCPFGLLRRLYPQGLWRGNLPPARG
jgi:glycosyltransferase involved in cell wall biosynthesis